LYFDLVSLALPSFTFKIRQATSRSLDLTSQNGLLSRAGLVLVLFGPPVVSDCMNSTATLNLARKWLQICLDTHRCKHEAEEYWRPIRLIKLDSPSAGSVTLSCRLDETATPVSDIYMSLSHCWGHHDPFKLTRSTLPALLGGVPVSKLPQDFQDARFVTRYLGLKFVWTDSLCIFQDSREDWVRESSLMGKVYSQVFCNIGAAASPSRDEGCFRQRKLLLLNRTIIESSWKNQLNANYHLFSYRHSVSGERSDILAPLLRRG
jgi:hypothetical protein